MSVVSQLKMIAPHFDGDPDFEEAEITALSQISGRTIWGARFEPAVAYLIAHILTLRDRNNPANTGLTSGATGVGGLTSLKTGGVSIGFGAAPVMVAGAGQDAIYKTTDFGNAFLALRQQNTTTPMFGGGFGRVP